MTKKIKSTYKAIGVMAGSSMDGLDVVLVSFSKSNTWSFDWIETQTFPYDEGMFKSLLEAPGLAETDKKELDITFGKWIAQKLLTFSVSDCDVIAVHGHTVIHEPHNGISWQLGSGSEISKQTGCLTITDFRTEDVKLGGQGAPLVPVGDFELLSTFDACLNLGGIANVSICDSKSAWDVCSCNQVLNYFANKLGKLFDEDGKIARKGSYEREWIEKISSLPYFSEQPPKSLPNASIPKELLETIEPLAGLRSYSSFISDRIIKDLKPYLKTGDKVLATGGGAHNSFLMDQLNGNDLGLEFVKPETILIEFKEALVFAFLGVLKLRGEVNVLSSVTGAERDSSSGSIHFPK